ncbi:MAG: hypothetical protein PUC73_02340 [Lachnospiraceae bacterium]|nr:hypothetical protein [Lachnospiraceae bacterium]
MKEKQWVWLRSFLFPVVCLGALLVFLTAVSNLSRGSSEESKKQLEEAIRRSVITCYATEGIYPPDFAYVKEKYGIQVDEARYLVVYDVFAENLMPDITVLERNYEERRK